MKSYCDNCECQECVRSQKLTYALVRRKMGRHARIQWKNDLRLANEQIREIRWQDFFYPDNPILKLIKKEKENE
jgi:hypothetical protein